VTRAITVELPAARGHTTAPLLDALREPPHHLPPIPLPDGGDPLADEDLQLALYLCYELHYRGLPGVDERWEWSPSLLGLRAALEHRFEHALRAAVGPLGEPPAPERFDVELRAIEAADDGPSLSRYIEREATLEQAREFVVHRSAYQLKEADPHSWAIARLTGAPKAALVEIQADEYGGGRAERMHAQLFADVMGALGLDARYGAYVDVLPAGTLATVNLMSLCGLHRRLRGAIAGHLAIAAVDLAGGLARSEPELARDVLWGAKALVAVERRWADALLAAWERGESSLRRPLAAGATAVPIPLRSAP
jgi:Iron-containing redox enzyme